MAKKDDTKGDALDQRPPVKIPGEFWWWMCMLLGLAGMVGAVLVGAGFPLPGG
jgi:hypothetical protein